MAETLAMVQQAGDKPTLAKKPISRPKPEAHQALVKISHVAQNPTDGTDTPESEFSYLSGLH